MRIRRVALIGHSEAGKSARLVSLGFTLASADMDSVLGTRQVPTVESVLNWIALATSAPTIVVVSNHEQLLDALARTNLTGQYPKQFSAVCFVYLHKPKDQPKAHIGLPTAEGHDRGQANQQGILDCYERFHDFYCRIADSCISCSGRSVKAIASEVGAFVCRMQE